MANSNIDFLRFSAYSMKELITRKLSEDSHFTDQIYEGSNLAILIDIVSYMYQCLVYQLNSAAAESMFADTQLYDNMIRLVQFIGYNPRGCLPAQFVGRVQIVGEGEQDMRKFSIPMFTYFTTQKTDKNGKTVCFSVDDKLVFESDSINSGIEASFYNGKWRVYSVVFTASGLENETFVLDGLQSDSDKGKYISGDFIRIAVETKAGDYEIDWRNDSNGIFTRSNKEYNDIDSEDNRSTNLYDQYSKVYTVCLNENKTYEIKFGDNVTGKRLNAGDRVYVFYLESNGEDGEMDLIEIDFSKVKLEHDWREMETVIPKDLRKKMFGAVDEDEDEGGDGEFGVGAFINLVENDEVKVSTTQSVTTKFKREEGVDDIRNNAPGWFKTGNRLITAQDTEYYIKAYGNQLGLPSVVDVKCMNNMQYMATLYKWLYENGIKSKDHPDRKAEAGLGIDPGRYYLDNVTFNRASFKYVDPADANNTYLWIKTGSAMQDEYVMTLQQDINKKLCHIKTITTEYQIVKPVLVKFAICANPDIDDIKARYFNNTDTDFDQQCESRIEITLDDNIIYVSSNIQKLVYDEIVRAFDVNAQQLGGIVKFQEITDRIYAINGVQRVRTVYANNDKYRACDGISFASWSDESVLHFHEDLQVGNVMRHVEDFQFPVLEGEGRLLNRIKVITKAMQRVHAIKF